MKNYNIYFHNNITNPNDIISITWYSESKTLLFQGQNGQYLKDKVVKMPNTQDELSCEVANDSVRRDDPSSFANLLNDTAISLTQHENHAIECTECRKLSVEMAEVNLDVEILM